ncbi:hypothetical protein JXC34_01955 [Candidatus Woesearchaeota archaeon]|nr:hypothetical protein [Candidatus Woesearchaeota archaeon]
MNKKGVIEIQFNWIYVAIVGAIILGMFVAIANGIRQNSRTQLESDAINYFDEIFVSMQGSENTELSIMLPGLDIKVDTDRENCNFYTIENSKLGGRSTEYVPIFSPDVIKKSVLSYSLRWDVPFTANYFLYLSSPDLAHVFIGGAELNELRDELPNHLSKFPKEQSDSFKSGDFKNQNYYKIRFITINKDPSSFGLHSSVKKMKDDQVSAINIKPDENSIEFYQKKKDKLEYKGTTYYTDMATMMAALYSENIDSYECNMGKALERMNRIAAMLNKRNSLLMTSLSASCSKLPYYTQAQSQLSRLEKIDKITKDSFEELKTIEESLYNANEEINDQSCPTIY